MNSGNKEVLVMTDEKEQSRIEFCLQMTSTIAFRWMQRRTLVRLC